ncbi:MAG TPA: FMN-binding protein [Sedimentisphaerales bacterium]|nr:FMN-binding protein [Sedimentisphaerales bacterium]
MQKWWFPILYMFLITAFFSSVVIGLTQFNSERVAANEKIAFEKAVVQALAGLYVEDTSRLDLHRTFVERVTEPDEESAGAYTLRKEGQIVAYALPFSGRGFWAPIKGVIGIDADRKTINAIAFYQQNETPGLGAEITKPPFRQQFEGKVIAARERPVSFKRPGAELGPSDVHAVTGATQTSTRLEKIINTQLVEWRSRLTQRSNRQ